MPAPTNSGSESSREILLDVSRLVWRSWDRKLPTGIDRVCLAYLAHFRNRARAVIQRKNWRFVLTRRDSERLFQMIYEGRDATRLDWIALGLSLAPSLMRAEPLAPNAIYLNVGHTGLDGATLAEWISRNHLRAAYMVHDLIPVTHPQYCRSGEAEKHERRLDNMLASASGIIGNSQSTLTELQRYASSGSLSVPLSIAALIAGHRVPERIPSAPLERPYFLIVGTIEARKNHMLLLNVWRRLVRELGGDAPRLVIVGQRGWEAAPTLSLLDDLGELDNHVIELNGCDDEQLASWIAGARALLMPSFVEGFGLPIIEALQLSAPVIATNLPVYREIAGDIPTYLDPADEERWLTTIKEFVSDGPDRRRQMAAMGTYQAPCWADHFDKVDPWLEEIAIENPRSENGAS